MGSLCSKPPVFRIYLLDFASFATPERPDGQSRTSLGPEAQEALSIYLTHPGVALWMPTSAEVAAAAAWRDRGGWAHTEHAIASVCKPVRRCPLRSGRRLVHFPCNFHTIVTHARPSVACSNIIKHNVF